MVSSIAFLTFSATTSVCGIDVSGVHVHAVDRGSVPFAGLVVLEDAAGARRRLRMRLEAVGAYWVLSAVPSEDGETTPSHLVVRFEDSYSGEVDLHGCGAPVRVGFRMRTHSPDGCKGCPVVAPPTLPVSRVAIPDHEPSLVLTGNPGEVPAVWCGDAPVPGFWWPTGDEVTSVFTPVVHRPPCLSTGVRGSWIVHDSSEAPVRLRVGTDRAPIVVPLPPIAKEP